MSMGTKIKRTFLLRITTMTTARDHVNLLYITAAKTSHYAIFFYSLFKVDIQKHVIVISLVPTY